MLCFFFKWHFEGINDINNNFNDIINGINNISSDIIDNLE